MIMFIQKVVLPGIVSITNPEHLSTPKKGRIPSRLLFTIKSYIVTMLQRVPFSQLENAFPHTVDIRATLNNKAERERACTV